MVQTDSTNFLTHPFSKPNKNKTELIVTKNISSVLVDKKVKMNHGKMFWKKYII